MTRLPAEMVKVEDHEAAFTAVDTGRADENLAEVDHVAALAEHQMGIALETVRLQPPRSSPHSGPDSMAIDTCHVAFGKHSPKPGEGRAVVNQSGDMPTLAVEMVEFEDERIALAAVDTLTCFQELVDEPARLLSSPATRNLALLTMSLAPGTEIVAKAFTTPPLAAVAMTVEAGLRKISLTPGAPLLSRHAPLVQLDRGRLGCGELGHQQGKVTNPEADG